MQLHEKLSSWLEFLFYIVFTTVLINQIQSMESIYNDKTYLNYLIVGIVFLLAILLGLNLLLQHLSKIIFIAGNLGFFVFPLVSWTIYPIFIVFFFISLAFAIYPFFVRINLNFPNKQQNPLLKSESQVNLIGIGVGILIARYIQFFPFSFSNYLYIGLLYAGILIITFNVIFFRNSNNFIILTNLDHEQFSQTLNNNLIFIAGFFLFESAFLPNLSFAPSSIPIEIYLGLQLFAISTAIIVHLFLKGDKLYCPVLFLILNVIYAVAQTFSLIMAALQIIYEILMINMLFIYPQLPRISSQKPSSSVMKINMVIWLVAIIILIGGQFIFPHGDPVLQLSALFLANAVSILIWIKPRFMPNISKEGDIK